VKTEQEIKDRLKRLEQEDEWPAATELLLWMLEPPAVKHEGKNKQRCDLRGRGWLNKETVFARKWDEANHPPSFLNSGRGTLEWLLCAEYRTGALGSGEYFARDLTQPEATAAASAIQWLGTNVGWCWLEETLRECGYALTKRKETTC
jgi:hypothetical protein